MFDFSFTELLVVGVVALIVIGPQRLPKVARTAGHMLGRLQRYVSDVKSDIQREMQLEDLKKLQLEVEQQARELQEGLRKQAASVEADLGGVAADARAAVSVSEQSATAPVAAAAGLSAAPPSTEAGAQMALGLDEIRAGNKTGEKV